MLKFTKNFGMTFAKKGTYGVPEFARTEVNRRSGNLKGLSGYLQAFHKKSTSPAGISTTRWSEHKQPQQSPRHDGRSTNNHEFPSRGSTEHMLQSTNFGAFRKHEVATSTSHLKERGASSKFPAYGKIMH